MVSTRQKKRQQKIQFIQVNETSNQFVIGNHSNSNAIGTETLGLQTNRLSKKFGRTTIGENSATRNQVVGEKIDNRMREVVVKAVIVVKNPLHDAIFTAMDTVGLPGFEMTVISTTVFRTSP